MDQIIKEINNLRYIPSLGRPAGVLPGSKVEGVVVRRRIPEGAAGLPERLRDVRQRMYLSQSKLSVLAGLGRITVNNIEERRSQGNVGIMTVEKLAKVLHVSPCWLAYGAGSSEMVIRSDEDQPAKPHKPTATQSR